MRKNRTDSPTTTPGMVVVAGVAKYFLQMLKPRLVLVAFLVLYYYDQNLNAVSAAVHAEISQDGQIHLSTPTKFLSRIDFDKSSNQNSDEPPAVGPFIGNAEFIQPEISLRKKKNCEMPSVVSRGLLGSSLKRSYFATTADEVQKRVQEEKEEEEHRMRRRKKRNAAGAEVAADSGGALPWTCETNYEWKDMGADHYPRFVRTAECKSKYCVRGFYRCKPRRYKTKILKRNTGTESNSCEEDDVSLPETLRSSWRFITVTINLCCDCTGPGRALGGVEM